MQSTRHRRAPRRHRHRRRPGRPRGGVPPLAARRPLPRRRRRPRDRPRLALPMGLAAAVHPRRSTTACPAWRSRARPSTYPTKDEVADYLAAYAAASTCRSCSTPGRAARAHRERPSPCTPARAGCALARSWSPPARSSGRSSRPSPATSDPDVAQLHTSAYREPRRRARPGPVIVVGAGNSGRQIALELAATARRHARGRQPRRSSCRSGSWAATCSGG